MATWAFFNLVFIMNVSILIVNFYTLKIDKTGLTKKLEMMGYMLLFLLLSALFFVTVWLIQFTLRKHMAKFMNIVRCKVKSSSEKNI